MSPAVESSVSTLTATSTSTSTSVVTSSSIATLMLARHPLLLPHLSANGYEQFVASSADVCFRIEHIDSRLSKAAVGSGIGARRSATTRGGRADVSGRILRRDSISSLKTSLYAQRDEQLATPLSATRWQSTLDKLRCQWFQSPTHVTVTLFGLSLRDDADASAAWSLSDDGTLLTGCVASLTIAKISFSCARMFRSRFAQFARARRPSTPSWCANRCKSMLSLRLV